MLTKKEKIELRERAYKLAHELKGMSGTGSANILAEEIHQFLSKDLGDDPLRLETPSPHPLRMGTYTDEEYEDAIRGVCRHKIDWDRPQWVRCIHSRVVYQTSGRHNGDFVTLNILGVDTEVPKSDFEYYSEITEKIQEAPQAYRETSQQLKDVIFTARKDEYVLERPGGVRVSICAPCDPEGLIGVIVKMGESNVSDEDLLAEDWVISYPEREKIPATQKSPPISDQLTNLLYGHQGEILLRRKSWTGDTTVRCHWHNAIEAITKAGFHEEQLLEDDWEVVEEKISEESKATGLSFMEAIRGLGANGVSIRRPSFKRGIILNAGFLVYDPMYLPNAPSLSKEDLMATDWQIIKE